MHCIKKWQLYRYTGAVTLAKVAEDDLESLPLSLAMGSPTPGLVYMGTARHGVFHSLDGGYTWEDISVGLPPGIGASRFGAFSTVAVSPADDSLLLVGTELSEIFRSPDGGATLP